MCFFHCSVDVSFSQVVGHRDDDDIHGGLVDFMVMWKCFFCGIFRLIFFFEQEIVRVAIYIVYDVYVSMFGSFGIVYVIYVPVCF